MDHCRSGAHLVPERVWHQTSVCDGVVVAKKCGGVLRVPRPRHPENDPEAADKFKQELGAKLEALPVPQGSRVRVWAMDEARFGLHTEMRRVFMPRLASSLPWPDRCGGCAWLA
jgi:hypothetical protein